MNVKSAVESILFLQGEAMAVPRLTKAAGAKKAEVEAALRELQAEYRERGIRLIERAGEWQMVTSPENEEIIKRLASSELAGDLSRSGLEVLAIVAYKGPISRSQIEYIRGVDSSFALRGLLLRGLVERSENPEDRRAYLYRISINFLKHLGLANLAELPEYEALAEQELTPPSPPAA